MKIRRYPILTYGAVAVLILVGVWNLRHDVNPRIGDKRLSEHLKGCAGCGLTFGGPDLNGDEILVSRVSGGSHVPSDIDIIAEVQPESWPLLVRLLSGKEPRTTQLLRSLAGRFKFLSRFITSKPNDAFAQQVGALLAFKRLGSRAEAAVPSITKLLNDPDSAVAAMIALTYINPARELDILQLTNVLRIKRTSKSGANPELLHSAAILSLGSFGERAVGAIPVLTECLASTNGHVKATAAVALAQIGAPPETVLPAIIDYVTAMQFARDASISSAPSGWPHFMNDQNLKMHAWAVGHYGTNATSALPVLSNLLTYPVVNVQRAAKTAIRKIQGD